MNNLNIVLVSPKYPRNIGMVSRVMTNYGANRLILVSPQCELTEEAKQGAAQGQGPLSEATIYDNWEEFYANEPDGPRLAFSRRQGKRRASQPFSEVLKSGFVTFDRPTYFIFGAEDHGLSSEDLEMVHRMAHFDLPGSLHSMNLSHSVVVALQSLTYFNLDQQNGKNEEGDPIQDPEPFLQLWLETLNFDLESQSRWNALTMIKQLIMKAAPTAKEMHSLEMIVQQTVRRLKDAKRSQDN